MKTSFSVVIQFSILYSKTLYNYTTTNAFYVLELQNICQTHIQDLYKYKYYAGANKHR